ncbi:MAG: hypothetical protein PHD15_05225 [Clostridia bacterium]|nr:hypothetical protein [Clostridia bacterium]MDD4387136.1 hypothetical protein [Clostridia bacterium]
MSRKKGISLIVLVITIIVIIILAGAVILSLANNNPIESANEAMFKSNISEYNSELALAVSDEYLKNSSFEPSTFNVGVWDGTGDGTGTIKEYITSITPEDGAKFVIQNSKLVYVGEDNTERFWVTGMEVVAVNVIATENSTVNGQAATYQNPIIPTGFKAINDGTVWPTDWNTGLVIEDASGNQFVWVPVDGENVSYAKNFTYPTNYGATSLNTTDDELPDEVTSETNQITKYGGFYIARYEAGNSSNILVSKKNATVWSNISYDNAKLNSELMYTTSEVKSGIITGTQWDTTMEWINDSGKSVIDSRTWGNHSNSLNPADVVGYGSRQVAGYSEYWKSNNIYDLAGNVWEWTNEIYSSYRICRGDDFAFGGNEVPASFRDNHLPNDVDSDISTRIVLYIL